MTHRVHETRRQDDQHGCQGPGVCMGRGPGQLGCVNHTHTHTHTHTASVGWACNVNPSQCLSMHVPSLVLSFPPSLPPCVPPGLGLVPVLAALQLPSSSPGLRSLSLVCSGCSRLLHCDLGFLGRVAHCAHGLVRVPCCSVAECPQTPTARNVRWVGAQVV